MQPEPPQVLLLLLEGLGSGLPSPRAGFVAHQNFLAAAKMALVGWGADELFLVWDQLQKVTWKGQLLFLPLPN